MQTVCLRLMLSLIPCVSELPIAVREGASVGLDFFMHIALCIVIIKI